jgi:CheY-like chemotaxis protein
MTERARILLVDDRPENLLALEAVLGSLDQTLVRAGSGEEALRALLKDDFALILLDTQMPGMDGFETAARIKRRTRTKDIPIIFLTAVDTDQNSSYRGSAAGGADYIAKPFDPWILRAKVQVFVDLWAAGRRLATQAAMLRDQIGAGDSRPGVLGPLRDGLRNLQDAVLQLTEAVPVENQPSVAAALERVQRELDSMGDVLAVFEEAPGTAGATRREFG